MHQARMFGLSNGRHEPLSRELLSARPLRSRDPAADDRAFASLRARVLERPEAVLQYLSDAAMAVTSAHSAGVSLLETDSHKQWFRWRATSGQYEEHLGATMPADESPCGLVLQRNATVLLVDPVQQFPEIKRLCQPVSEALLAPFHRDGAPIGTVWAVAHTPDKCFDREDGRLLSMLAEFASAGDVVRTLVAAGLLGLDELGTLKTTLRGVDRLATRIVKRLAKGSDSQA
jgi:hypothetical protein